jgi:hypothetical protein
MLTCPHGHYEIWEQWRKNTSNGRPGLDFLIATDEYEEWPRGRIVYSSPHDRFVLYADAQILSRPDLLATIYEKIRADGGWDPSDGTETRQSLREYQAISGRRGSRTLT